MRTAEKGDKVSVHFVGTLKDGSEFDSSKGGDPLHFTLGAKEVISGFDSGILGMAVGERKDINIPFKHAYGPKLPELIQTVPRNELPDQITPKVGMVLRAQQGDGKAVNLTVTEVSNDTIIVDGNHPMAGLDLNFAVTLVAIN
jgi:FKBP-type peptidyl-prolyl cis-trans isomerase 2